MTFDPDLPAREEFTRTRGDIERWRRGDPAAFESLWTRHRPGLEVLVATEIRSIHNEAVRRRLESEAEDVVQDVAATVLAKLGEFEYRGQGSLGAWMEKIVSHRVWNWVEHWEAGKRNPHSERPLDGRSSDDSTRAATIPARGPGPATSSAISERRRQIADVLAALPKRHRQIVVLRFYFGAEWNEIAAEIGAPSDDAARKEFTLRVLPSLTARLKTV
ncbi:MAG: sigma-70 family RNA polymerase sigma factor [Planctomycetes bacterium]|nr:sigma-70 family RNA polymerase sigma factor [Planctomycetota bacterium]MBI3847773.1 sigma-70 family RNA polymerase sigma factor [Planctomycetota bacterium]